MDAKQQSDGEKRVQSMLIDWLEAMGLTKPSTMRKDQFETMKKELRQMLAYMQPKGLETLRDWCAAHPGGRDRDRFPIALKILERARHIEPPDTGPSPLMLNVFGHDLGLQAIQKGFAPELLTYLKAAREWPGNYTQSQIKMQADDPVRRLEDIELRMSRGDDVAPGEAEFRDRRLAALRKCQAIRDEALAQRAEVSA